MALVPAATLVGAAFAAGRGVGAFNVIGIEHAEAILAGAEAAGAAVVLQISENCVAYHGSLAPLAAALLAAAGRRRYPPRYISTTRRGQTWCARQSGSASGR